MAGGAGLALLLSMGSQTPLYALYHALPTGAWFRSAGRLALLVSLALAALAGMGVMSLHGRRAQRRRALRAACLAAAAGLVVVALGGADPAALLRTAGVALLGLGLLAFAGSAATAKRRAATGLALVLLLFGELFFAYRNPYFHPQLDAEVLDAHEEVTAYLRTHAGGARVVVVDNEWGSWAVQRRYGLLNRVRTLNDFEPLTPTVYKRVFRLLDGSPPDLGSPFDGRLHLDPARGNAKVLDMLGVRYVLVDRGLAGKWSAGGTAFGLRQVPLEDPEVGLFENPGALPRATLVPMAAAVDSEEAAGRAISDPAFDPGRMVVVQGDASRAAPPGEDGPALFTQGRWREQAFAADRARGGDARILRDGPERVEIEARVGGERGAWLVLMDLDFPGWKATIDGRPAEILPANLAGRAVALAPGTHRVVFHYEAGMFRLGCWMALGAAVAWGAGILLCRRRAGARPCPDRLR